MSRLANLVVERRHRTSEEVHIIYVSSSKVKRTGEPIVRDQRSETTLLLAGQVHECNRLTWGVCLVEDGK